jgi:hypothetical protein
VPPSRKPVDRNLLKKMVMGTHCFHGIAVETGVLSAAWDPWGLRVPTPVAFCRWRQRVVEV